MNLGICLSEADFSVWKRCSVVVVSTVSQCNPMNGPSRLTEYLSQSTSSALPYRGCGGAIGSGEWGVGNSEWVVGSSAC